MIIKGRARGGGSQLAAYLTDKKNERVTVLEVSGTQQPNLRGALREMEAVGLNTTTSQQVLYHAQIAPAHADELTQAQFIEAADRLGKSLKLDGQPRVLVMHEYQGHQHLHIVWSRADVAKGQVISNSWDRVQHHRLCRTLEREWGLELVQSGYGTGGHNRNPNARDVDYRQNTRLREAAKEEGKAFRERDIAQKEILWCWENSPTGQALTEQLKQMGYSVMLGRTGLLAVDDQSGAEYSIARYAGVTREAVRERCADVMAVTPKLKPKQAEQTAERKAGRHVHMSRRKAKAMLAGELAHNVVNDTGNYEKNKQRDRGGLDFER